MTTLFGQGSVLTDLAALLTAMTGLIAGILGLWKYWDERGKRMHAEQQYKAAEEREREAEARNEDLESENVRLAGGKTCLGSA
jgi:hypothetical protein